MLQVHVCFLAIMIAPVLSVPTMQWERSQAVLTSNISRILNDQTRRNLLPVDNPIQSYWLAEPGANPLAQEGSEGPLTEEADICIIGSGITGASAAYHLSQLGSSNPLSVIMFEARDFCSGATGRNGGHFTPNTFHDFIQRERLYGTEEAIKTFDLETYTTDAILSIISRHGLGEQVDHVGSQHNRPFTTSEEEELVRADSKAAIAAGVNLDDIDWHTADQMREAFGTPFPAVSFPGNNLYPLKLVTELYKLAKNTSSNLKLDLHTHTPVTSITKATSDSNRRWALRTPRGEVQCDYVIHATNAYANHLIPPGALDSSSSRSGVVITPTRGQVMALRAGANLTRVTDASWGANEGFEYWFPRPVPPRKDGEKEENPLVIIGGGREAAPGFEVDVIDDGSISEEVSQALKDFLPGLFSGTEEGEEIYVKGREPEQEWTGIMGFTASGDPFVGPVFAPSSSSDTNLASYEGQYIAAGYTGHGMTRAFACAEVVVRMVHSAMTGEDWVLPDWMPKHYLTMTR